MGRITITDLSRITGFSKTTISHVLNNKDGARISPATREEVRRAAREHNYVPNFFARNIIRGRSRALALAVRSLDDPACSEWLAGAVSECRRRGYQAFVAPWPTDEAAESALMQDLIERGVEGLFAETLAAPREALRSLRAFDIALVLGEPPEAGWEADAVFHDLESGFRLMAEALAARGHRKAVLLSSGEGPGRLRSAQAAIALEDQGIQSRGIRIKGGEALADPKRLLGGDGASRATAAVCLDPLLALGLLTRAARRGPRVPDDLSIIAVGATPGPAFESPRLARLDWPERERGRRAAELLIERSEQERGVRAEPRRVALPPHFDEGETLGPAPGD